MTIAFPAPCMAMQPDDVTVSLQIARLDFIPRERLTKRRGKAVAWLREGKKSIRRILNRAPKSYIYKQISNEK